MKKQKDEGVKIDIKASPSLHDIESNIRDLSKVKGKTLRFVYLESWDLIIL